MVPPRRPPRLLVPRDATETARQGQGVGDLEAIRQAVTVPAKAARQAFLDAGAQQRAVFGKLATGQYEDPELQDAMLDFAMPAAGTVKNVGREMLERSRLVGRPIDFEAEKAALGRILRAEAEQPLPAAMRDRPLVSAEHSTSALFRAPEVSRRTAGRGAGDWWQGPGFYISESKGPGGVSGHYREETAYVPQFVRMPSGIVVDRDAILGQAKKLPTGDPRSQSITNMLTGSETYYDSPEEILSEFQSLRKQAQDIQKGINVARGETKALYREQLRDVQDRLSAVRQYLTMGGSPRMPERIPQDLRQATYGVEFAARPDEIFDLQRSVLDQPASERIRAALTATPTANPSETAMDRVLRLERQGTPSGWKPSSYEINEMLVGNKFGGPDLFADVDAFQLMEEANARGVVGNKYLTRLSAENPKLAQEYNYVVQDPSRVRLTDVWAAAPIGLALNAAERQQRKQEPQAKR